MSRFFAGAFFGVMLETPSQSVAFWALVGVIFMLVVWVGDEINDRNRS